MPSDKEAWIVIPARQGKGKNTWTLGGRPMVEYCMAAAVRAKVPSRIICTTNDLAIQELAVDHGIEVNNRPEAWSGSTARIADVIHGLLLPLCGTPEVIVLVQPTSPFVTPMDIDAVADAVLRLDVLSAMTMTSVPHNFHAWNQRTRLRGRTGDIDFIYRQERLAAGMKQQKPPHLAFGNVVAVKSKALALGTFFPTPCLGVEIDRAHALDVDEKEDLVFAEALLANGTVSYLGDSA
jgi:CMP-N-acetylneuraminic acid synthetase